MYHHLINKPTSTGAVASSLLHGPDISININGTVTLLTATNTATPLVKNWSINSHVRGCYFDDGNNQQRQR